MYLLSVCVILYCCHCGDLLVPDSVLFKGIYNQRWIQIRADLQRNRDVGHHAIGQPVHPPSVFLCGKRRFYGLKENVQRCLERVLAGRRQFQEKASMPFGVWLGGEGAQYPRKDKGYSSLSC